jgi:hypothetical protein
MSEPSVVEPQVATAGHRVRGAISGISFGLGLVILLQQFAIVPMTTLVLVLVPLGAALIGLAVGWTRPTRPTRPR